MKEKTYEKITVIEFIVKLVDGGSQVVVQNYVETIDRNKFSLMVLTLFPFKNSTVYTNIAEAGIPIKSLYPRNNFFFRVINKFMGKVVTSYLLRKTIEQLRPSTIHVHSGLLKYFVPIRSSIENVKLFYTCHSLPEKYFTGKNASENKAAKILIRDNNLRIIALHKEMANELNHILGINNTLVLNNGINIHKYKANKENKQEIRQSLNIPADAYVIGHVGRFDKVKNHIFLLDIFAQILQYRDAHLLLVGDGHDGVFFPVVKDKIKRLGVEKRVTILSHRNDVYRLLKAFDVFVFPSLYEGLSLALLEAQASGLRCVISDRIPAEARVLDSTVAISLDEPAEYWCNVILDDKISQPHIAILEEYDIFQIVKRLQGMYMGHED